MLCCRALAALLILGLVWTPLGVAAPSPQYTNPGTPVIFADSAQTPTAVLSFTGIASQAGRISARYDKGVGARPSLWELRCRVSLTGTNIVGQDIQFYIATSDGTDVDNGLGTADAAIGVDQRRNLLLVGALAVYQTTTNVTMYASFRGIYIPSRYFSVVVFNNSTLPLQSSTTAHRCVATPQPFEMQ